MIDTSGYTVGTYSGCPSGVYFMASTECPVGKVGRSSSILERYKAHRRDAAYFAPSEYPPEQVTRTFSIIGVAPHGGQNPAQLEQYLISVLRQMGYQNPSRSPEWFLIPPSDHELILKTTGLIPLSIYQEIYGR